MTVPTGLNSEQHANELFETLVGEHNATLPNLNLGDDAHEVPWHEQSDVLQDIKRLTVEELLEDFKKIQEAVAASLRVEYTANRITGAEYTKAYIALVGNSLNSALQFALSKDQAFLTAARTQAEAISANSQNEAIRAQTVLSLAQYALAKLQLAKEDSQFGQSEFQREEILPAQKALIEEQTEAQRAQTLDTRLDGATTVGGLMGKQKELYEQQRQSYIKDIEIKAANVFANLFTILKGANDATEVPPIFYPNAEDGAETYDTVFSALRVTAGGSAVEEE